MKSVLISIRPEWCELIALGKKTVEVRKTRPKLEPPFKVYIYCTIGDGAKGDILPQSGVTCGKVIGEFVCDEIFPIRVFENGSIQDYVRYSMERSCVPYDVIADYIRRDKTGCGWHISDLVIYDQPRDATGFYHYCGDNPKCDGCEMLYYDNTECGKEEFCCSNVYGCKHLKRPPQSWCYVVEGVE